MRRLFSLTISMLIVTSFAFAQSNRMPGYIKSNYKTNKALSDYLDAQGFKFGLSRDEATKIYNIDPRCREYWCVNSGIIMDTAHPIKEGFYYAEFDKNNMTGIRKCIGVEKTIDKDRIKKEFETKYGLDLPAFINHHGRYLYVDLDVSTASWANLHPRALVLITKDNTDRILAMDKEEQMKKQMDDSSTERLKKKF